MNVTRTPAAESSDTPRSDWNDDVTRRLVDGWPEAVVAADAAGSYVGVNLAALTLLGYQRDEFLRLAVADVVAQEPARTAAEYRRLFAAGRWSGTVTVRRHDGELVPIEAHSSRIELDGSPVFISVLRDLRSQIAVEERLRRSEVRLDEAQRLAKIGSWEWDPSADSVIWSVELVRIYGQDIQAPIATFDAFLACVHPDDRARVRAVVEQAHRDHKAFEFEHRIVRPDGSVRVLYARGEVCENAAGGIERTLGIGQDVTDERRAEDERTRLLAEREARQRAEQTAERVISLQQVTAKLAEVLSAGEAADVVLNHAAAALGATLGTVVRLVSETELEILRTTGAAGQLVRDETRFLLTTPLPIAEAVRTGRPVVVRSNAERVARYPLFSLVPMQQETATVAVPMIIHERAIGGLSVLFPGDRPFTEEDESFLVALAQQCGQAIERAALYEAEQTARAEAQAALHNRDAFASSISHDLRTPLTAIKGEAQLLSRQASRLGTEEGERFAAGLQHIDAIANRMSLMLNDLFDLTRLQHGEPLALHRRTCDLCAVVNASVDEALLSAGGRHIELDSDPDVLTGDWDADRLERVVANLLSNAIKYSPDGSAIRTQVRAELAAAGSWAILTVRDEGVGIPAADLPRIFEPFHRGANVAGRVTGTGIGLAGARQIVEQHGGTIAAASTEGAGTTITVRLPLPERAAKST